MPCGCCACRYWTYFDNSTGGRYISRDHQSCLSFHGASGHQAAAPILHCSCMLEGRRGDLESQVPIMNKEQPAATFTTISAQESNGASIIESLSESHHVSTTDHQLSYGLVESKPGIDVLSNNKQSEYPTSCTQASSDDNNNSNSILERVSHQINSFEYSQESSSSYSPLSWQLSRVYQNNSDNLLKVDELSSSIVDENVNFKYLNQNENFGEMIASSKVPTTKINSIATSKDITLSSTSSSSMIDGQTVTVSSPVIVNSVSIQRTAADGDCVFSDQQCEYEQASESRINLESQAINDDSNSSDNIVRNVSYENTPSTKRQTNSLFTQFQSSVDDGTKQSQELAPNQYENIQSEHAISQSTDSRMVIQDIISNASSDDVLCEKGALLSIPDDGCEEYIQDVHAASNPQIIASNSEACDKNTSALLIKNKLILSNAEASVSLSNNPQSDGITVSPSQYTVSSKHQLMNLEPPPIDSIINADPNISSISTSSQSLQVYPPELLTADLSNVQSDKSFTDVQLNVIKTEPQFSPEPSINSSITLKTEESSVPAIAIKQEVPSMDPDSIECKTEPNDDDCYSINKNLTLPSVATLPPFSSTSHDLAIAHANADQIHYIQQPIEAGHEFSSPEEAARVPLILSNSNQTTVLPSIFKMTNSSNATTLTPLTQASIPQEERQGIEPSVVAPVLSMSSGPFATFGGAANTDQPYLLIPVSANQQILAFASSLASSPNFTTPISSTITFNTQSNVVMNPTSTWPAVTTCSSLPAQSSNKTELASSTTKPTSSKNHVCNLCGKNFSSRAVHNLHMRSHSGEKPYPCMVCGRHFSQKTSLTRHMRSHTGERPFPCALCGKSFSDKERVKIHMRSHTGEKPFPCSVCGKHFSQKSTVKRHMSVHTGERPFKCETCGKGFANRGNLNSHIRTHSSTH